MKAYHVKTSQLGRRLMILTTKPKVLKNTYKNMEFSAQIANFDMP